MGRINFKNLMFVLFAVFLIINSRIVKSSVQLSPNVALSPGVCPQVTFNCTAVDLPSTTLRWFINDDVIAHYAYDPNHRFPNDDAIVSTNQTDVVTIEIVEASYSDSSLDRANFYSTLTTNLSAIKVLGGSSISCGSLGTKSTTGINFQYRAPPRCPPMPECSLVISPRDITIFLDSFTSGINVTNYRVVVSPTLSCSSDQLVSPSGNYNCSGLVLGTNYSFTVSAINCGNQEGPRDTFTILPQVPLIPEIIVFPIYNDENQLSQLTVTWQVELISDVCSFDKFLNYSIFLNDSRGGRLEERVVTSHSCNNNLCSTSFNILSSSNQSYLVSIYAVNAFGRSNTAESVAIENLLQMEVLSHIPRFEDCVTTLLCSSVLAEEPCVIQYGRDPSYENFDNHLNVSLNSPSPLPLMDALTQYYFQVEVRVNSTIYISRRSFMTREFAVHLTDANIGLLIIGILFLILGILIFILWIRFQKYNINNVWIASLVLLLVAVFLWLVSVCLWIAVGRVVGQQINTCDSKWQSNRDNLIIAAFVLSFISLLLFVTATVVAIYTTYKNKNADFIPEMDQKFGCAKPSQEPASKCQQCGSEFSIIKWNQPHYCCACGKCFCSLCTVNEANLPYDLKTKQKVCDSCYVKCGENGIQVYGPGPSRFYPPTSSQPCVCSSCSVNKVRLPYDEKELKGVCEECKKQGIKVHSLSKDTNGAESDSITEKFIGTYDVIEESMKNDQKASNDRTNLSGNPTGSVPAQTKTPKEGEQGVLDKVKAGVKDFFSGAHKDERLDESGREEQRDQGIIDKQKEVPCDPPSLGSGPARSDESKQPQKDGEPKESENQEQKIQGRSGNTPKETPHDTNQVEVTDTRSVANNQNEKSQQKTTATPVSFGAEAPELDIHSPNVCHACKKKVTSREYCRACGKVVCKKCSKKEAYLQHCANTVMVCPNCHEESIKQGDSSKKETTL